MSPTKFTDDSQLYGFFGKFADESTWATIFLIGALVKILGLIFNKNIVRKIGLVISAVLYGFIAYAYFIGSGWFSIGFGTFFAMSLMALWGIREVEIRNG